MKNLDKVHSDYKHASLKAPNSRKCQVYDVRDLATSENYIDVLAYICLSDCEISHYGSESGGSDNEPRNFFNKLESNNDSI